MAKQLTDFGKFKTAGDRLRLPVNGKVYEVPPVAYVDGPALRGITRSVVEGTSTADDVDDTAFTRMLLGQPLLDQLIADGVSDWAVQVMVRVAFQDFLNGREAAEALWEAEGSYPEAQARLAAGSPASPNGTATRRRTPRAAATTRTASGTGTSGPRKRQPTPATPGTKS